MAKRGVSEQMKELLEFYKDELEEIGREAAHEAAEVAASHAGAHSPKRTGEYKQGWRAKHLKTKSIAYDAEKPGLTMLLEYGHAKRGGGRVVARPHIKDAEQKGEEKMMEVMQEGLKKLI